MSRYRPILAISALALLVAAGPVAAQQIYNETPTEALKRNLNILSDSPNNMDALLEAGRASIELGDYASAAGFFGRAEDLNPRDPRPKAGKGATLAEMGDAAGALASFADAERLGGRVDVYALSRGLAYDLVGQLKPAQADYRKAMNGPRGDEARRRLALSLAMSGEKTAALAILKPLLDTGDPAARRTHAFVLALTGDIDGARRAIDSAMPGASSRIDPFFRKLPLISIEQKAAAVHLGIFPQEGDIRLAQANSRSSDKPAPSTRRQPARDKRELEQANRTPVTVGERAAPPERTPATNLPSQNRVEPVGLPPTSDFTLPSSVAAGAPEPRQDRLASIDNLLASGQPSTSEQPLGRKPNSSGPPPAPQPKYEPPPAPQPKVEEALVSTPKVEPAKPKPKPAPPKPDIGVSGTYWIQLAGGGRKDAMPREWSRIKGKAGGLLDVKSGHVTQGVDYFRLVAGPFKTKAEAQTLVNKLRGAGIECFVWTRDPALIKIEKIAR